MAGVGGGLGAPGLLCAESASPLRGRFGCSLPATKARVRYAAPNLTYAKARLGCSPASHTARASHAAPKPHTCKGTPWLLPCISYCKGKPRCPQLHSRPIRLGIIELTSKSIAECAADFLFSCPKYQSTVFHAADFPETGLWTSLGCIPL